MVDYKVICGLIMASAGANAAAQESGRPCVIQILTDDQGWGDLNTFGHQFIKSPNIDKLADEGVKFTQCYSSHAVSSPSRSTVLTGRTPYRNGVYNWIPANHFCHLPENEVTIPQILREDGYQTAHFGKWHLSDFKENHIEGGFEYKDFQFSSEPGQPSMSDYGYDYYLATGNVARPDHKNPKNFFLNGEPLGDMEGYSATIVADYFVDWMENEYDSDKPFFITVWFHEPHGPVNSDPEIVERYNNIGDKSFAQYLANVSQVDDAVGRIVESLKKAGVYDNTFIFYTSDNGPEGGHEYGDFGKTDSPYTMSRYRGSTGGLQGRKRSNHEGGVRVPGIMSWPKGFKEFGVQAGNVCGEPVISSDFMPTILDILNIDEPKDVTLDGQTLLPLIKGSKFKRKNGIYWRNETSIALRDGDWKIIGNPLRTDFKLYNISIDYRETTDLAAHYPKEFEKMKQKLIEYDKEVLKEGPTWYRRENYISKSVPQD